MLGTISFLNTVSETLFELDLNLVRVPRVFLRFFSFLISRNIPKTLDLELKSLAAWGSLQTVLSAMPMVLRLTTQLLCVVAH